MKTFSIRLLLAATLAIGTMPPPLSAQTTYVNPYAGDFSPTGSGTAPWSVLREAAEASQGATVEILGTSQVYGATRLDRTARITRNSASSPVKIGAVPLAHTTFRCVSYNARLAGDGTAPTGWADAARAAAIRDYPWGNPDFIGFCEVWNSDPMYTAYLANMPGTVDELTGFDFQGATKHSGLCARSRHPLSNKGRGAFSRDSLGSETGLVGTDWGASKGWLRGRIVKDGIGIWVFMTHTQADLACWELPTWTQIYRARSWDLEYIRRDIRAIRNIASYASDVFFLMGDFNVFGDGRGPSGNSCDSNGKTTEYSDTLSPYYGVTDLRGMDAAKQIYPQDTTYTYDSGNSLAQFWDSPPAGHSGRLDYIIAFNSADGKVVVEPTHYEVIKAQFSGATDKDHFDTNLSDHYAIAGDFRIFRIAN
jgi:hypothetical protein